MLRKLPLQRISFLLAPLAGCLYALGFPNDFIPPLIIGPIFGLAILFHLVDIDGSLKLKLSTKLLRLLAFSVGHALFGFYWIPHTLYEFGGLEAPWNYLLGSAFSLIVLPQYWIFLIGLHWLSKRGHSGLNLDPWVRHMLFAVTLATLEFVVPQQFPAHPGHSWMEMAPHLGLAPIAGVPLFSFFSYWLALCVRQPLSQKQDWWGVLAGLLFVTINGLTPIKIQAGHEVLNLRIVQPNIGNFIKLSSERGDRNSISKVLDSYRELSLSGEMKPDLIIWPETAYPHMLRSGLMAMHRKATPRLFREIMEESGAELVIGGYDMNPESPGNFMGEYNAAFHFATDGKMKQVYRKHLLIPFGEGLPFGPLNKPLSKVIRNVSFFAAGENFPLFETASGFKFGSIICYETLFAPFVRNYLEVLREENHKPDFLLNLTNDSWYGKTAEPYQHLFLAKWRAVEFALPMVRSTNTGVTSIIYPDGSESKQTGIHDETILEISVPNRASGITLYQKYGLAMLWFIWIALNAIAFAGKYLARKTFAYQIVQSNHTDKNS